MELLLDAGNFTRKISMEYYVSFGQLHPLRDGYVVVIASSYENARTAVIAVLGNKWASLNTSDTDMSLYPAGQIGRPIIGE
jgi:hypothetical protein